MFKTFLSEHSFSEYEITPDVYPTIDEREYWDNFGGERFIRYAEAEISYDWPIITASSVMAFKKSGNRTVMEDIHESRRVHFVNFVFAELCENKGRFIPQIVDGMYAICEETYWGLSAHWFSAAHIKNLPKPEPTEQFLDLFSSETAEHLVMAVTMLRRPLLEYCPEIVERVYYELDRRIKTPYLEHTDFWWMGGDEIDSNRGLPTRRLNNWTPWIISNVLAVFALTEGGGERMSRALAKTFTEMERYFLLQPEDGGCDEGPAYWQRAGVSLFEFVYQLKLHTSGAIDLFDDEKLGRIAAYIQKLHTVSGKCANVADSKHVSRSYMMPLLFGFAKETGQPSLMNFAAALYKLEAPQYITVELGNSTVRRLILSHNFINEINDFDVTYPLHTDTECLPNLELAVIRGGDITVTGTGGFNATSHNHNDVGSFSLYFGDEPVLIDVGIGTYSRDTFSENRYVTVPWTRGDNHNIPIVNGVFEVYGKEYRADAFSAENGRISVSFAGAYAPEAELKALTRELKIEDGAAVCTDRFEFAGYKTSVTEVLMSTLGVKVNGNTATLGDKYVIRASVGRFSSEFMPFNDPILEKNWGVLGVNRITLMVNGEKEIVITVRRI